MQRAPRRSGRCRALCGDLPLADHVRGFDPGDGGRSRMERFETHHRTGDTLDKAMVLFQYVIEEFNLSHHDGAPVAGEFQDHVHRLQAGQVGTAFVDHDPVGHAVRVGRPLEEPPGSGQIAALREQEVKGLAIPVHGAVEVGPLALHLDAGLIHQPGGGGRSLPRLRLGRD